MVVAGPQFFRPLSRISSKCVECLRTDPYQISAISCRLLIMRNVDHLPYKVAVAIGFSFCDESFC